MMRTYFITVLRNILRRPVYSLLNIITLATGLTIAGIAVLYVKHELSYDAHHKRAKEIYRLSGKQSDNWFASLSAPYSNAVFQGTVPGIQETVRTRRWPPKYLKQNAELFYERKVLFTDVGSKFFDVFDFEVLAGSRHKAFQKKNSAVITKSLAEKLFGSEHAIGKSLSFDTLQITVTAVMADLPSNTNLDFNVLICNDEAMAAASAMTTYVIPEHPLDAVALHSAILTVNVPDKDFSRLQDCAIIPLTDLHFEGNMTYEAKPAGNKIYLAVFALIAGMVLVLAIFNFVNLSVAVYAQRSKEIAVRKIVGANRRQLFLQFLLESTAVAVVCLPLVLLAVQLLLPFFNSFMAIRLTNEFVTATGFLLLFFHILTTGILAGLYPAVVLPRINSLSLFKNQKISGTSSLNLRTALVGAQMVIMVLVVTACWMIQRQISFIQNADLGFRKEGVIKLPGAWAVDSTQFSRIKATLLENPHIVTISQGFVPGDEDYPFPFKTENDDIVHSDLLAFPTDHAYFETLGIEIVKLQDGLVLDNDARLVLINETLAKRLQCEDPIGQRIIVGPGKEHERTRVVNGVFKDFHFNSLHQQVKPMMLNVRPFGGGISENILIKIKTERLSETVAQINNVVRTIAPSVPLSAEFVDEDLSKLYDRETKLSFFSTVLLVITILLAAIGLLGLASFVAQMRTKEIGIRKILGATVQSIIGLVSFSFVRLTVIAFALGSVASYFMISWWLQSFTYKVEIAWQVYALSFLGVMTLIIATVGSQAWKASAANPVESIRGRLVH